MEKTTITSMSNEIRHQWLCSKDITLIDDAKDLTFDAIIDEIKRTGKMYIDIIVYDFNRNEGNEAIECICEKLVTYGICTISFEHKTCIPHTHGICLKLYTDLVFNASTLDKSSSYNGLKDAMFAYDTPLSIWISKNLHIFEVLRPSIVNKHLNGNDNDAIDSYGCELLSTKFKDETNSYEPYGLIRSHVLRGNCKSLNKNSYGSVLNHYTYQPLTSVTKNDGHDFWLHNDATYFPVLVSGSLNTMVKQHTFIAKQYINDTRRKLNKLLDHINMYDKEFDDNVHQLYIDTDLIFDK